MERDTVVLEFRITKREEAYDLEVPLQITANELVTALNSAFDLQIDTSDIKNCYLIAEKPIALLRGHKTLAEYGIRNGSIILYTR